MKFLTTSLFFLLSNAGAFQAGNLTPSKLPPTRSTSVSRSSPARTAMLEMPASIVAPTSLLVSNTERSTVALVKSRDQAKSLGNALLLSDKMTAFFANRYQSMNPSPSRVVPYLISAALKLSSAQLLVQATIALLANPYQQALLKFGKAVTLFTMSFAALISIFLGIGLQMLPYFIPVVESDRTKSLEAIKNNICRIRQMLPAVDHFSLVLVITAFIAMMTTKDITTIPQNFNIIRYATRRSPLILVADFVFHAMHRVAHLKKSKNPLIKKVVKVHKTHHSEDGIGVLPLSMLHGDLMECLGIVLVAMIVLAPFNGAHPLVVLPLWVMNFGFIASAAHSSTFPLADDGFHLGHHVHQQGNYGLDIVADRVWGTYVGKGS